jgi:hypothetical protein
MIPYPSIDQSVDLIFGFDAENTTKGPRRMTQWLASVFSIEPGAGMLILLPSASKWLARHANVSPVFITGSVHDGLFCANQVCVLLPSHYHRPSCETSALFTIQSVNRSLEGEFDESMMTPMSL